MWLTADIDAPYPSRERAQSRMARQTLTRGHLRSCDGRTQDGLEKRNKGASRGCSHYTPYASSETILPTAYPTPLRTLAHIPRSAQEDTRTRAGGQQSSLPRACTYRRQSTRCCPHVTLHVVCACWKGRSKDTSSKFSTDGVEKPNVERLRSWAQRHMEQVCNRRPEERNEEWLRGCEQPAAKHKSSPPRETHLSTCSRHRGPTSQHARPPYKQ